MNRRTLVLHAIAVAFSTPVVAQTTTPNPNSELAAVIEALEASGDGQPDEATPSFPSTTATEPGEQVADLRERWATALVAAQRAAGGLDVERNLAAMSARVTAASVDVRKELRALPRTLESARGDIGTIAADAPAAPAAARPGESGLAVVGLPSAARTPAEIEDGQADLLKNHGAPPLSRDEGKSLAGGKGEPHTEEAGAPTREVILSAKAENHAVGPEGVDAIALSLEVTRLRRAIAALCESRDVVPNPAQPGAAAEDN